MEQQLEVGSNRELTIMGGDFNGYDGDFLWKAEFTYKHKNQSSHE